MARTATAQVVIPRQANRRAAEGRSKGRHLRLVRTVDRSARERAYWRVCDLAWVVADREKWQRGWVSKAARSLGLEPGTMSRILNGTYGERLGLMLIERVATKTRRTIGSFCDE